MFDRDFLRGGFILVFCFGVSNLINFGFHLGMARFLTVAEYGVLATLLSIIYLLSLFSESIQTVISKYASSNATNVQQILRKSMKDSTYPALLLFLGYLVISFPLSHVLAIPYLLLSLNGLMIFGSFYMPINRGLLQGRKRFFALGSNMIIEAVIKLVLSVFFVWAGFAVYGAVTAGLLGAAFAYGISFFNLTALIQSGKQILKEEITYDYDKQSFLTILAIMVFFSIDVVVARMVFEPDVAGSYAIASIIAKTIFFAAQPLGKAMFSFTAEKEKKEKSKRIFLNALSLTGLGIVVALILFYFFPYFWVHLFSGKDVPLAVNSLFIVGVAYSLMTLTNVVLLYQISTTSVERVWLILLMPVVEFLLLFFFSDTLFQFALALVASSALFLSVALRNSR